MRRLASKMLTASEARNGAGESATVGQVRDLSSSGWDKSDKSCNLGKVDQFGPLRRTLGLPAASMRQFDGGYPCL